MVTPAFAPYLVLNVDGDAASRAAKTRALAAAGELQVVETACGADALKRFADKPPALVLLNVELPDINGYDLCRTLKSRHPEVLVLETSASLVSGQDRTRGLDAGADSYLVQPCDPAELVATVRALLRIRDAEAALRESEANFRLLADNMPAISWMAEAGGDIYWFNKRWYDYTGLTVDESLGWSWRSAHDPAALAEVEERWRTSLQHALPFDMTFPLRGADGVFRPFLTRIAPVRDAAGQVARWFGTNIDISPQRAAEEELRGLNDTLEQRIEAELAQRNEAERALRQMQKLEAIGQLTGGIAHDFNNMMAVVISALNLLERRLARGETDVAKYIEAAVEGATRASALTRRLLTFSRQQAFSPETIEANATIKTLVELLERTLGEHVRLETAFEAGALTIYVDASEFENALLNLSVNSRDAMPNGGRLCIATSRVAVDSALADRHDMAPGEYASIAVSDTGVGMTPEVLEKAFDPFFTTKDVGKGTGLGLSQVFGFVRQSGGGVRIDTQPGEGASVVLYLPLVAAEAKTQTPAPTRAPAPTGRTDYVVLVVEDEPRVRAFAVETLRDLGYAVLDAVDGRQALDLIEAGQRIDLLFTDVVMPGVSGAQLYEFCRERLPDMKVLFTTGYAAGAFGQDETHRKNHHFIAKPYRLGALASKIRAVLEGAEPPGR